MSVIIGIQNAYAAVPDCVGLGKAGLLNNELYVGDENAKLWKVNTLDGLSCSIGVMKDSVTKALVRCTDLSLDPTTSPQTLYCITFTDLYEIDRSTADATFVGNLMDGIVIVTDMNAFDIDTAGVAYAASISGNFYSVDLTDGSLLFRSNLGHTSAGDLAYHTQSGKMYWTSLSCPGCSPVRNGLWKIDLVTNTATFIDSTGFLNVFAGDFIPIDTNLHFVNNAGRVFELEKDADLVAGTTFLTSPVVKAFGGTGNQALVGGIKVAIDTTVLLLGGIYTSPVWLTPAVLGVVGLVAFKLKKKN